MIILYFNWWHNISFKYIPDIIEKSKKFGEILISRVYADFSEPENKNWKTPQLSLILNKL